MRLGVVSDIHGNGQALEAALDDGRGRGVDAWLALGDLVAGGPDPVWVLDLLEGAGAQAIRGNTDRELVELDLPGYRPELATTHEAVAAFVTIAAAHAWTRGALAGAGKAEALAALPATHRMALPSGGDLLAVHAWLDRDTGPGIDPARADDDLAGAIAAGLPRTTPPPGVIAGGHTHAFTDRVVAGVRLLNPGSLSYPRPGAPPATYAIVDARAGELTVERRVVSYDMGALVARARRVGYPAAQELADSLARAAGAENCR